MKNKDLHSNKDTGFKTPKGYFESLEDRVFKSLNQSETLKEDILSGFKMPDGYLDTLESKVFEKIEGKEPKVISIFSRRNLIYASSIAAALVLLFSIFINKNEALDLDETIVENYLLEQDLSNYELVALLDETDLLDDDFEIIEEQLNESSLEDYLLDNSQIETIIEQ